MSSNYQQATLSGGLRVIVLPSTSPVVYCGIGIRAGSRQETPGEEGVAHFCEHVTFKGTRRRSALQIGNALESVGGDLNAFTNKEDTVFYAAILKEHLPRAVDLLTDIVFSSVYPEQEVAHEVDVICDEIESYNDSPAELIYDEFENLVFRGHPLGHNILGTREGVKGFTSQHARRFTAQHYRPDNAIFFAYGDVDFDRLLKRLERNTVHAQLSSTTPGPSFPRRGEARTTSTTPGPSFLRRGEALTLSTTPSPSFPRRGEARTTSTTPNPSFPRRGTEAASRDIPLLETSSASSPLLGKEGLGVVDSPLLETSSASSPLLGKEGPGVVDSPHHQAHVMLGSTTFGYDDARRMPLFLLNNILGGPGMNARLNVSLRERHGLVYTVESTMASYSDTGCWSVYFGCDHHDVRRCLRLVHRELDRVMQQPLSERQLAAAKRQLKGQIAIACDNREQYALDFAKSFLHYGRERDIADLLARIDDITAPQLQDVAQQVFDPHCLQLLTL